MHQAAVDLFQLLVQAGAVPGEDFSCDPEQQAYHLNERCYSLLEKSYPYVDWHDVLGHAYANVDVQIETLHQELGCPFVYTLMAQMRDRLTQLSDDDAAGYVQAILVGVESATGIALYPFLMDVLNMSEQARLEWLLRQAVVAIPGGDCLLDLITAAGIQDNECQIQGGEAVLTEAGWQRLSRVWNGNCTLQASSQPYPAH